MHVASILWAFLAYVVHGLPILNNHEEAPWNAVAAASVQHVNGTVLMAVPQSSMSAPQEHSDLLKGDHITISDQGVESEQQNNSSLHLMQDGAASVNPPAAATQVHEDGKEVQAHVADTGSTQDSHKSHTERTLSGTSKASGRKQVVRSRLPSLDRDDAPHQADPRGFFWLHWELLRLAKPGLLIFAIFATIAASMAFLKSKPGKQQKELCDSDRSERLLAVAQRLHSAKQDHNLATEPSEVPQTTAAVLDPEHVEAGCNSTTDHTSELQKVALMEELGFTVPSTEDLFLSPTQASPKKEVPAKKASSSAPHLSPEMALSEETRSRRTAIINILRNLPDVKDHGSSSCQK